MNPRISSVLILAALLSASAIVPLSAADQAPKAISQVAPVYPFDSLRVGIEGAVLVSFNINSQGKVDKAVVVSSTDRAFEGPALSAVKRWNFTPATKGGLAISVPAKQIVVFIDPARTPKSSAAELVASLQPQPRPSARIVSSAK